MRAASELVLSPDGKVALEVERRLVELAQRFDVVLRDRVTLLLLASAEAIVKLAELEVVRHQVCTFVAEVERASVVPGYRIELENSLLVRQATTNLSFLFRGHARRIGAAAEDRIAGNAQDALKDLHAFSRTRALPQLRTSDKR